MLIGTIIYRHKLENAYNNYCNRTRFQELQYFKAKKTSERETEREEKIP